MKKITSEQLDGLIRSAVNSSGPLPPDEKFSQIISALRELRELRAAMLQGAEPVQGWIPCSERMPEENAEQEVIACFKGGDISTLYYFKGRWDDAYGIVPIRQDVTHWMPMPAAPQQEADNG